MLCTSCRSDCRETTPCSSWDPDKIRDSLSQYLNPANLNRNIWSITRRLNFQVWLYALKRLSIHLRRIWVRSLRTADARPYISIYETVLPIRSNLERVKSRSYFQPLVLLVWTAGLMSLVSFRTRMQRLRGEAGEWQFYCHFLYFPGGIFYKIRGHFFHFWYKLWYTKKNWSSLIQDLIKEPENWYKKHFF